MSKQIRIYKLFTYKGLNPPQSTKFVILIACSSYYCSQYTFINGLTRVRKNCNASIFLHPLFFFFGTITKNDRFVQLCHANFLKHIFHKHLQDLNSLSIWKLRVVLPLAKSIFIQFRSIVLIILLTKEIISPYQKPAS